MKVFLGFTAQRFAVLMVLLIVEASARCSLAQRERAFGEIGAHQQEDAFAAQQKGTRGEIVVLQQREFAHRSKDDASVFEQISVKSLDGNPIVFDQLPAKAKETLAGLEMRVFPLLEISDADPRDAIRIIIRKPKPTRMIRLGLIEEPTAQEADPFWLNDLSFGKKRVSCVVTNVSFLDLSLVLAKTLSLDFGIMPDGQPAFRNKDPAVGESRPDLYVVKPKSPKSQ